MKKTVFAIDNKGKRAYTAPALIICQQQSGVTLMAGSVPEANETLDLFDEWPAGSPLPW